MHAFKDNRMLKGTYWREFHPNENDKLVFQVFYVH